jgi:Tol biopolymer transport system component
MTTGHSRSSHLRELAFWLLACLLFAGAILAGQSDSKKDDKKEKNKPEPFKIRRITQGMGLQSLGPVSPDGRSIALIAKKPESNPNLYVMNLSDFAIQPPLTRLAWGVADPSWSPDSEVIAFSGFSENASFADIYAVNIGTRTQKQYTRNNFSDKEPVFTPDGKKVLFTTDESPLPEAAFGTLHVATVPVDRGKAEGFTEDEVSTIRPRITADKKAVLLIIINEHSGRHSLWQYGFDGKAQRDLTERKFARIHSYDTNGPNGMMVLWAQEEVEQQEFVYLFDPRTGEVRALPDPDSPKHNPSVSPDGKLIAYIAPTAKGNQLFLYNSVSEQVQQLTTKGGTAFSPAFISNTSVLFGSSRDGDKEIFLVDLAAPASDEKADQKKDKK